MKMLCLQEEVSLVKFDQFQHVMVCRSLPSALRGVRNGRCLQRSWRNILFSAIGIGDGGKKTEK